MKDLTDPFDLRAVPKPIEVGTECVGRGPTANDGTNQRLDPSTAELDHSLRLVDMLHRIDVHLHVDPFDHVQSFGGLPVIVGEKIPREGTTSLQPGQPKAIEIPEMHMRVNDRNVAIAWWSQRPLVARGLDPSSDPPTAGSQERR
jgi:hypothetical protein